MTIKDRVKDWLGLAPAERKTLPFARAAALAGRASVDSDQSVLVRGFSLLTEVAPSPEEDWRNLNLGSVTLDRISPAKLLKLLADLSPDVSKALWDFILFCNPGFTCKAYRVGSDTEDPQAQKVVDDFLKTLGKHHGTVDTVFGRIFFSVFLRGALLMELVLDKDGRTPVDLATPDPASLKFDKVRDDVRGEVFRMFQWQGGQKVYLERPTIRYVPLHPFMGSPYGRPMVAPALFSTLFLLGMLHDLRRVVSQQGYPRLDVAIDWAKLQEMMPADLESDPAAMKAWVDDAMRQFANAYEDLEPDDTYFHVDAITVNRPVGAVDASSLKGADDLIRTLERMSTRALKSIPLLMGSNEAVSETHANRQWEVHAASIKSVQHLVETPFGELMELALQAQGMQATVELRFAELRASELQRDALVEQMKLANARTAYDNGLISQDEQAQMALGKEKADQKEPRKVKTAPAPQSGGMEPDPGSNRARHVHRRSVEWEGLTLSRQPTPLETRVLKPIAKAQERGRAKIESVLMGARLDLIKRAVVELQGLGAAEYHTLVLDAPQSAVMGVRSGLLDIYEEGRLLVAQEVGSSTEARLIGQMRSAYPSAHYLGASKDGARFHLNGNSTRAVEIDDTDEGELDELARTSVSRLVNDVQSRAVDIATKAAVLLSGADLLDKITSDLESTSTGYVSTNATGAANVSLSLGRDREMKERAGEFESFVYSCVLDSNLCEQCEPNDGLEAERAEDLPDAPYPYCLGGGLCRCFRVGVAK